MAAHSVQIVDNFGATVARATVADEGGHFGGRADVASLTEPVLALFREFEAAVNDQSFAAADEVQGVVSALHLRARFGDAREVCVNDLQIYPSTGDISFRLPCPLPTAK